MQKKGFHQPNYTSELAKIKEFLSSFKDEDGDLKYIARLDQIPNQTLTDLQIELDDVFNFSNDLGTNIINNTDRYLRLFYKAVDSILPEPAPDFGSNTDYINAARVAAMKESESENRIPQELLRHHTIRFIPPTKQKVLPMREIRADSIGCLVRLKGMVTRNNTSQTTPLVLHHTHVLNVQKKPFKLLRVPHFYHVQICQSQQCKSAPHPGQLTLQTRGSKFIKFQMIRLQELSSEVPPGHIPRTMTVYARNELTQKCQTGDVIELDGIFLPMPMRGYKQSLINETYIEAQNIRVSAKCDEIEEGDDEEIDPKETGVYEKLAASVAPEIYGLDDVKKSLLLQLVGGVTRKFDDGVCIRGDINICLMGDPGVAKSQLLKWVTRVAPRSVYTTGRGSSGVGLTAAVLRDPITGEMALEGGALVLSDMGICCIDEFDKMEDSDRTAIYEVMEQQTVSIAKAGITTTLNARTSILAAANPLFSRYNIKKSLLENVNLPSALLSRFDLLFLLLDRPTIDSDTALANHIAYVHKNRIAPKSISIGLRALRRYIEKAKQIEPIIPEELSRYISKAYVDMRQETVDQPITTRALLAIIRLSMALARIRLSDEVCQEDVDEALRLVRSSKESVELVDFEVDKKVDVTSAIYEKIVALANGNNELKMNDVKTSILQSGFSLDQLEQTIQEYERLGVLQVNPSKTKLILIE